MKFPRIFHLLDSYFCILFVVKVYLWVIIGDIFSFQNLPEEEFNLRVSRYNWIFSHPDVIFIFPPKLKFIIDSFPECSIVQY